MASLEKQQVVSFLKILQIPTDLTPDEIKESLLEAGWNEKDANEAVTVLHPHQQADQTTDQVRAADADTQDEPSEPKSQIVAQKYVQSRSAAPVVSSHVSAPEDEAAAVRAATAIAKERAAKMQTDDDVERPHTDAPWLEHQVDIYDVTPEEREEMIRTVYRTNEKLSPQTIHALLGIDVDLSAFEHDYRKRHPSGGITWVQVVTIIVLSLLLAGLGFFAGMYYFEVGPFHPSLNL